MREIKEHRARVSEPQLLNMLFQEYEKNVAYKASTLANALDQPEGFVQEVLSKIAYQPSAGTFKSFYILRDEYRTASLRRRMAQAEAADLATKSSQAAALASAGMIFYFNSSLILLSNY